MTGTEAAKPALRVLSGSYAVCRLPPDAKPPSPLPGDFLSITRTGDELSLVCGEEAIPTLAAQAAGVEIEPGWRALAVEGPLDFSEIGILAALAAPLARASVPIFVISTYDTDYVLVKRADLQAARNALTEAGFQIL